LTYGQIQRLNDRKNPRNVIGAVWEVAIIRALLEFGTTEHEIEVADGSSRPDVLFRSNESGLEFLADVGTVSDEGLHKENWVTELHLGLLSLKIKPRE
jgi:hypothetical protein